MTSRFFRFKKKAKKLREDGFTYKEINTKLGCDIPKSTLTEWFRDIVLSDLSLRRINEIKRDNVDSARSLALSVNRKRRQRYLQQVEKKVSHLACYLRNADVAKLCLAMLYLCEGAKGKRGFLTFGNSNPQLVKKYVDLLRACYSIDNRKFRCTVQCRADQDVPELEAFWSKITRIPKDQFYKARLDTRAISRKTKKLDYRGVCRIDYFSGDIFCELEKIGDIICDLGL